MHKIVITFLILLSSFVKADPLNGRIELGTFSSDVYEARSTLVNPAALAFQTDLNGPGLLSSFTYGYNKSMDGEFSLGLSYGYLGFGFEHLQGPLVPWNRFSFASGVPITHEVFFGTRFSVTGSDDASMSGNHSLDFGIQYRPLKLLSLAFQANRVNKDATQWVGSLTVAPVEKLRLSFEADTPSNNFGKEIGYQGYGSYEVIPGLQLGGGYHKTYEYFVGLQFAFGQSTLFSQVQPNSDSRKVVTGFQTTVLPAKSFLDPKSTIKITLDNELSEEGTAGSFFNKAEPSLLSILEKIDRAAENSNIKGIVLKIESFPLGLAAAEELNKSLYSFREKGKSVEVFLGNSGTKEYLIASAASKISMEPSAELRILGPRSERFYFKGTLDKIGIQGEFLAKGEYKSAPETFTRKESSPQSKESTLAELKALEEGIQNVLTRSRKKIPAWNTLLKNGIYSAKEAKANGLIDEVLSYREAADSLSKENFFTSGGESHKTRLNLPPQVSVVIAEGDILQNRIRLLSLTGGGQITPDKMAKRLKEASSDPRTKAIVVRVSSPGGEILASQEIASSIEAAKKKKPVYISMGDMAASGGYMISAPSTRIFADSLTVTGSIGVFLGKVSLEGLYKKIDLKKEILGSSPYAGLFSESRPWTQQERALMIRRLNDYYGSFVSFVAEKRKISQDEAEKAAKGRVWPSMDALRLKLVDETGGLMDTVRYAAKESGLKEGDYEVELIRESSGLLGFGDADSLFMKEEKSWVGEALTLLGANEARTLAWISALKDSPFLYWESELYH